MIYNSHTQKTHTYYQIIQENIDIHQINAYNKKGIKKIGFWCTSPAFLAASTAMARYSECESEMNYIQEKKY